MNQTLLLIAGAMLLVGLGVQLFRTLRSDGYGTRPPPPSRPEDIRGGFGYRSMV